MPAKGTAIIIVDHGSRSAESNALVDKIAQRFDELYSDKYPIVEPAHMELAEPSIAQAFDRCVRRGAKRIVVTPFFLGPGKHWTVDIPKLAAEAAAKAGGSVEFRVAAPLGLDDLLEQLLAKRVAEALEPLEI